MVWLFLASTLVQAADCATIPDEAPMTVVGEFTNMRFTGEHQYGYELTLWRAGGCLVGFFYRADGLAGDTPMGELQNVAYDSKSGRLSFESKLRTGNVTFAGEFRAGRVTGIVTPGRDHVTLRPTNAQADLISGPRTYRQWRDYWAPILRRLGPSPYLSPRPMTGNPIPATMLVVPAAFALRLRAACGYRLVAR